MILILDTTKRENITVELENPISKKSYKLSSAQKHGSQVLLPLIVKILKKANVEFEDLTEVKVNPGPGSFTGTRVGVTVANAIGFALKIPVNGKKGKIVEPVYEKSKFD